MSKRQPPKQVTLDEWLAENVPPELLQSLDSHPELITLNLLVGYKKRHFAFATADGDLVIQARLPMPKALLTWIVATLSAVVSAIATFVLTHVRGP